MQRTWMAWVTATLVLTGWYSGRSAAQETAPKPPAPSSQPSLSPEQKAIDEQIAKGKQADARGDLATAGKMYQAALQQAQELKDAARIAKSLNYLGAVYYNLEQFNKALDLYQRELALREKIGNQQDIATSLNNLGVAYNSLGQFDKALDFNQRALSLFEKLGNSQGIAASLNNLGLVYNSFGQFDKTLDFYQRSLSIQEKLGNKKDIADIFNNLGNVYERLGQFDKAVDYLQRSLSIYRKSGNPQDIADSFNNLAAIYDDLGQFDKTLDFYKRSQALLEKLGNPQDIAHGLNNLGNVYDDLGRFDTACDFYKRSQALLEKLGNPQDIAANLYNLAQTEIHRSHLPAAEAHFQQALTYFESVQAQVTEASEVGAVRQSNTGNPYPSYANLLVRLHRPEEALTILERGRTRGLAKQAAQNRVDLAALLSPDDARQLQAQQTELRAAQYRWQNAPDEKQQKARKQEYDAQLRAYEQLRSRLFAQPRYADFRRLQGDAPPTFAQLQRLSRQHPDTLYLEYSVVDTDKTLLFALQNGVLQAFALPVGEKTLSRQVNEWRLALTNPVEAPTSEARQAKTLSATLLGSVETAGLLKNTRHLVVVADGPLLDVPFAALLDSHNQRLIARIPLSSAFSLGALTWPVEKKSPSASLLCAADPFGAENQTVHNSQPAVSPAITLALRETPGPLPSARQEATTLVGLVPGAKGYLGAQATVKRVTEEMPRYAMLHFATHGLSDGRQGMCSCLALADGYLSAREIAGMKLSAQLATLSACQTARGEKSGGEGLLGLAWAFRAAGVPAIVASQWRVSDVATGELMGTFYKGLLSGKAKDVALQRAMESLRKRGDRAKPFFWAAFTVIGANDPLTRS